MVIITSKDNKHIKEVRKLMTKKGRKKSKAFLIEGDHLVEEAMKYNIVIQEVFLTKDYDTHLDIEQFVVTVVNDTVMKSLSSLTSPPGIIAIAKITNQEVKSDRVLALDGVQDPGNLGSLIRTADAFNFRQIIIGHNTVDPYSEKVLRSAQGSHFHLNIETHDLVEYINHFKGTVLTTSLDESDNKEISLDYPLMIVLGNEGHGVSERVFEKSDVKVRIEMTGEAESLNVSIAGGILMHQYRT